ncbi:phosphate ABC transporter permease PstA [Microbulbifer sp. 2205BS26-8]|uniref:phosphate ABC transporter permease PstA n=1 Tax=Microbulbifer sp. 2205BS26-8 TaxID=3064386 RepID=UPI00273DC912|nr:phosphate ABC transporter permease PstA [Microbulbifer sp. 2205BS26-8]MDP5209598.1 phosphate ABC transporter permease PstA [Microbulbifer sp. 2205BS26-8]
MNDLTQAQVRERIAKRLASRHRKEKLFRGLGVASIVFGVLAVVILFIDIISKGSGAFVQTAIQLDVHYDAQVLGIDTVDDESLAWANFTGVIRQALRERFPSVTGRSAKRELYSLVSSGAPFTLRDRLADNPGLLGKSETVWLATDDDVDTFVKSLKASKEGFRGRTSDQKAGWIEQLLDSGELKKRFNTTFFTNGDSREPEQAGIRAALIGSLFTLLVTLTLSFPIGVAAAIYLEEYAPKNRWTDLIEVNINNLAAVPSIVFGLLGLAIFINFFELPRSAPLVGGLVLTLMTLPTIIISSRAALKAVPPSIREAAMGMGASPMQVVFHHVLPLAMPGMLTGAIIGMAQALGETAPLLMIGMVAFIVDVPTGITDPATVLPVQIFLWADSPERAFVERTSAAIMVLLSVLIVMNTCAVLLRKKLERRW